MKIAVALILLVIGSVLFHLFSPWYLTPIASNWDTIDDTISLTFWVTGFVFVAVNGFLAYVVIRYKKKENSKADYDPENKKLEVILTVATIIGVVAMLAPGLVVYDDIITVPEDAHVLEVVGQQWQWSFRYPGKDGKLGKVETTLVSPSNPFGINPKDPDGKDDILVASNEIHIPLDKPVKVVMRSKDVLHNFTVPQFRVKMDLVPGTMTYIWFTPTRTGTFDILCEELCGVGHFTMRGRVVVDSQNDFQTWLKEQPTFEQTQNFVQGNPDKGQLSYAICASCHGQTGEGNLAMNSPKLAGMGQWYISRQLNYYQHGIRGKHEKDTFGQQMAPMASTLVGPSAVNDVSAYIQTLQAPPVADTIEGDAERGFSYFVTCGTCHGDKGQGNQGLNAPRLAGQHDWYIKRQLENFKQGIRGRHKQDRFGVQMLLMSKILQDDKAMNDLVAYINTL
jgi:cytochrome c oxidase subunit 2